MPPTNGSQLENGSTIVDKVDAVAAMRRVTQRQPFSERQRSSILVGQRSLDMMAIECPGNKGPKFVMFTIRQFRRWGYFIAEHDWKAMLICIIISAIGFFKVLTTPQQNNITGYSPYGARARTEYTRYQEFFAQDGLGITFYIYILAKDGGSMLREAHLNETIKILTDVDDVKIFDKNVNKSVGFSEFCNSFCNINEPIRQFHNGFIYQNDLLKQGKPLNSRIKLNYPLAMNIIGSRFTLQQNFYGIDFFNDKDNKIINNDDNNDSTLILNKNENSTDNVNSNVRLTNMESVKIIVFQFRAEHKENWTDDIVKNYERQIVDRFQKNFNSNNLQTYVLSQTYIEEEMIRAGISLLPYLSVGFLIMCTCSVFSVVVRAVYMHQHSAPKILLAIMACILPFMSCSTALALMFFCKLRFSSILCVIPFLVLAIGVDSSYLMIHEWQRVIKHCRDQPTRKNSNVGYRISEVLSEVGPAILISVLTNLFADGVGAFTSSPEITLLCVGNMISMAVAFLFQMTFYAGLFSLVGRYEIISELDERREFQASLRAAHLAQLSNGGAGTKPSPLTRQHSKFHENTKNCISKSIIVYVNYITKRTVALIIVGIYLIYLAIVFLGITRIEINLTTQKLFALDSPLLKLDQLRTKYQVPHFSITSFFVNDPGDLSNSSRLEKLNDFVNKLESVHGSWGQIGTQYFVRDFIKFEKMADNENGGDFDNEFIEEETILNLKNRITHLNYSFREKNLYDFIQWPEFSFWKGFIKLDKSNKVLKNFFFITAYHGKELSIWTERAKFLQNLRKINDNYSMFDPSVFHDDAIFLDLIDNMATDTWQSVLGTLICMGAVCFLFLNSMFTVIIASSCVLSICAGILGILSWSGIDIDPITMAAMIISIGCSVDIPAHVSYHYYQASLRETSSSPNSKLNNCLSSVAFPALQAGISTILCVSSLLFVPIYMAEVFVKTMVICVILCNLHGLVFLPAFLILFDSAVQKLRQLSAKGRKKKVHILDNKSSSRMGGEPPAASVLAANKRQDFAKNRIKKQIDDNDIESNNNVQCNLSRISSKTENSVSSITDRPELNLKKSTDLNINDSNLLQNEAKNSTIKN